MCPHLVQDKVNSLLEKLHKLAPSYGPQPYTVLVIDPGQLPTAACPAELAPGARKVLPLLVFAEWADFSFEEIQEAVLLSKEAANIVAAERENFVISQIKRIQTERQKAQWVVRQISLAMGIASGLARQEGLQAAALCGFNREAVDQALGLKEKGLSCFALLKLSPIPGPF